jgi:D-glycero-alpha-D-manno-heptose-7-phosphate kinase
MESDTVALSVKKYLERHRIQASAPCRIDSGGTWDIKSLALPLEKIDPVTINIALNLRTWVTLSPFDDGKVNISSEGFAQGAQCPYEKLPFNTRFGLFFAALSYFGYHGLHVHVRSDSPVKSALGGSSTALVSLIKALSKLAEMVGGKRLSGKEILHLGYQIEDGVSRGNCGMQDQAAAVYGGVNRWQWRYGERVSTYKRESLLDARGRKELSKRILVAYSGKSHASLGINRAWVVDYLAGKTRSGWVKVNEIVHSLATAIKEEQWEKSASLLRAEMAIRREITPDALIPFTAKLIDQAEMTGCGARFTGAGGGGSVWALGDVENIGALKKKWEALFVSVTGAKILDCAVDPIGVR